MGRPRLPARRRIRRSGACPVSPRTACRREGDALESRVCGDGARAGISGLLRVWSGVYGGRGGEAWLTRRACHRAIATTSVPGAFLHRHSQWDDRIRGGWVCYVDRPMAPARPARCASAVSARNGDCLHWSRAAAAGPVGSVGNRKVVQGLGASASLVPGPALSIGARRQRRPAFAPGGRGRSGTPNFSELQNQLDNICPGLERIVPFREFPGPRVADRKYLLNPMDSSQPDGIYP